MCQYYFPIYINRSFAWKAKGGRHVRICDNTNAFIFQVHGIKETAFLKTIFLVDAK
jgi:hypothetical protein